jgi:hypothetical protein
MAAVNEETFRKEFCRIFMRHMTDPLNSSELDDYRSAVIGTTFSVCLTIWKMAELSSLEGAQPKHLLWALCFLKVYPTQLILCILLAVKSKTTAMKWIWIIVECIFELHVKVIRFENRFIGWNKKSQSLLVVDGKDCRIPEQYPFDPKWYSHKFDGPGVRYEIGVSIFNGGICWINGPFPCGSHPDTVIFEDEGLSDQLEDWEKCELDSGYRHNGCKPKMAYKGMFHTREEGHVKSQYRSYIETINGRFASFGVVSDQFRNDVEKHGMCFFAVGVIVQLSLEENPSWSPKPYNIVYGYDHRKPDVSSSSSEEEDSDGNDDDDDDDEKSNNEAGSYFDFDNQEESDDSSEETDNDDDESNGNVGSLLANLTL